MSSNRRSAIVGLVFLVIAVVLVFALDTGAQSKFKTLYKFKGGKDGVLPIAGLVFDQAGNLYGTVAYGGARNCGSVYELSPRTDGGWTKKVLHDFTCRPDGHDPVANLIFDQAGNLYGTTIIGGQHGTGTVFELSKNSDGSWTEKRLHNFIGRHGGFGLYAGLIFDGAGNLYGTTRGGGDHDDGVVFKLTPKADGSWKETVLHAFTGVDGEASQAGIVFDGAGNLYGTTVYGGADGDGTVFKLTPNSSGGWRETVLHSFTFGKDGAQPYGDLIFDQAGNLYGTAVYGGAYGWGVVFELTPNADGSWTETVLHTFTNGTDGSHPLDKLIFDADGNLYGTTETGGVSGIGVVFKLAPNSTGEWKETVLHAFTDKPGAEPAAGLIFDAAGNLYGADPGDNEKTFGSVFEITP